MLWGKQVLALTIAGCLTEVGAEIWEWLFPEPDLPLNQYEDEHTLEMTGGGASRC